MSEEEYGSDTIPEEEEASTSHNREGMEVLLRVVVTMLCVLIPLLGVGWLWWRRTKEDEGAPLEEILASDGAQPQLSDADATSIEGLEAVKAAAWPTSLPGLERILAYEDLKSDALDRADETEDGDLLAEDRSKLRHALMDRCQAHVAWLLRLEREQRSMERLSRRGMISTSDYQKFTAFADELDAEVNSVREEAAWLCDDESKAAQAADEIWRIAVQIWQQRRQQQSQEAKAQNDKLHQTEKERDEAKKAKARALEAKKSLKGLKGGFLGGSTDKKKKSNSSMSSNDGGNKSETSKKEEASSSSSSSEENRYIPARWPEELPCAPARARYLKLKKATCGDRDPPEALEEGPGRQRLRQALMERCQHHVPFVRFVKAEEARARAALERSKWCSGAGAPTPEDLGKIQAMDALAKQEMELVEAEAEWLGDPSGSPGMAGRIWQHAFDLEAQMRQRRQEHEKQQRAATEKALKAYASREAKPWPKQLPGSRQRGEYETAKAAALRGLSQAQQNAMLQGRPAQQIIGGEATKKLREALVNRALQCVPLIQRLQTDAGAVKIASERGQVDDDDLQNFKFVDSAVKAEVEAVKVEADWLGGGDEGRRMGDAIWPHAFKVHAEKRQGVLAKLQEQKLRQQQQEEETNKSAANQPEVEVAN